MEKFTPLAKNLLCRRHWRDGQIPPLAINLALARPHWSISRQRRIIGRESENCSLSEARRSGDLNCLLRSLPYPIPRLASRHQTFQKKGNNPINDQQSTPVEMWKIVASWRIFHKSNDQLFGQPHLYLKFVKFSTPQHDIGLKKSAKMRDKIAKTAVEKVH